MALALFKLDELKYVHMSLTSANQADTLALKKKKKKRYPCISFILTSGSLGGQDGSTTLGL